MLPAEKAPEGQMGCKRRNHSGAQAAWTPLLPNKVVPRPAPLLMLPPNVEVPIAHVTHVGVLPASTHSAKNTAGRCRYSSQ